MKKVLLVSIISGILSVNVSAEEIPNKIYSLEDIEERYVENPFAVFMRADKILKSKNPDYKKAIKLLDKASKMGIMEATHNLGNMYYHGIGTEVDYDKALEYLYISGKADMLESQLLLADIFARKSVNLRQAYKWYYIAAQKGIIEAKYYIGNMVFYGKGTGMDTELGLRLLEEVAEETQNRKIFYELGEIYTKGINNPREYDKGIIAHEKAANLGYVESQRTTADMYEYAKGTKQNLEKALYWYMKAASSNDIFSISKLGDMHLYGSGTQKNVKEAIKWYKKAAAYNDKHALYQLASIYLKNEHGIEPNYNKAIKYYKEAVNAGHKEAMRELAIIYRKGIEDIVDPDNFAYQDLMKMYYIEIPKKVEKREFNLFEFKDDQSIQAEKELAENSFEKYLK